VGLERGHARLHEQRDHRDLDVLLGRVGVLAERLEVGDVGLVVPVNKDADSNGILDIAKDLTELSGKARAGKLAPGEMAGASFTISSLGGIGGTSFTPIVNAPEVAILGVTRSAMKPVWNGSEFEPRLMVPLSLSYDHRVIDGALAARFVAHLVQQLSDLRRVLL
jgi:pyruvate dehydrogenase E2 component (dihydrolipoamide acetyltransferase)